MVVQTQTTWSPVVMGLLPDTQSCSVMRRECRERFPRFRKLAIPTCITARASRTCRDACRDRSIAVSFNVDGGENVPGIPGACATQKYPYLGRGPLVSEKEIYDILMPLPVTALFLNFSSFGGIVEMCKKNDIVGFYLHGVDNGTTFNTFSWLTLIPGLISNCP